MRPDIVITFGPDGAYGHPDHIAIAQFTTAGIVAAADPAFACDGVAPAGPPHAVGGRTRETDFFEGIRL